MSRPIAADVLATPVEGRNLRPGTLRDQWGDGRALLIFLRHLGCLFSREVVADVRKAEDADPSYPPVLYVHLGSVADGEAFFGKHDPGARTVADGLGPLYAAFGIRRGTIGQLFSPAVIACGLRATRKGHGQGRPIGDPWMLPGMFVVQGDDILWSHEARHAADHPDFARIPEFAAGAASPR